MAWDIGADEYVSGTTNRSAIVTAVEFEVPTAPVSAPTTVAVDSSDGDSITISWVDPNDPDVPIKPFFRKSTDTIWNLASLALPAGTTTYTFEDLDSGTGYDVGVAAWDDPDQSVIAYVTQSTTGARTAIVTAIEFEAENAARQAIVTAVEFESENAARQAIVTAIEFQTTDGARAAVVTAVEFAYEEKPTSQPRIIVPQFLAAPRKYEQLNEEEFRKLVRDGFAGADEYVQRAIAQYLIQENPEDGDVLTWSAANQRWEPKAPA